jgi:hypothetical protein
MMAGDDFQEDKTETEAEGEGGVEEPFGSDG